MINRVLHTLIVLSVFATTAMSSPRSNGGGNIQIPLLRLKLVLDAYNNDDIAIGFLSTATTQYDNQIDSRYLPGVSSPEGLSCLSSDNVPLSVAVVPLPSTASLVIRLDVEAQNSGVFTLERTQLDSIPQVYDIWLMDSFAKDSLNLRSYTNYAFNINKSDSASFGSNRFTVVIRQNPALMMHLLSFSAKKGSGCNDLTWTTENEQNSTHFSIERSIDDAKTFFMLDSLSSDGTGSYTYTDNHPMSGDNHYRLKIQDMNAVITYSNVIAIDSVSTPAARENSAINIYPNPSNGVINLSIKTDDRTVSGATLQTDAVGQGSGALKSTVASSYAIRIVNIKGIAVKSATSSSASWQDNVSSLAPGTYIIQVINNSTKKLVGKSTFVKL